MENKYKLDELKEYAKACYSLGKDFYERLKKKKGKTLVVIGIRGGYPVWQGMLNYISKKVEDENTNDLLNDIDILYLPTSNKKNTREYTKKYFEKIDKGKYKNVFVIDEARSGSSVKGILEQLILPNFKDKDIEVYITEDKEIKGEVKTYYERVIKGLKEKVNFLSTAKTKQITMDVGSLIGIDYKIENGEHFETTPMRYSHPKKVISENAKRGTAVKPKVMATNTKFYEDLREEVNAIYKRDNTFRKK